MYQDKAPRDFARTLRNESTPAEKRLWQFLRAQILSGHKFRRQAAIGSYIVDFVCHQHRLIVELDGGIHDLAEVAARDVERDLWLTGRGYRVMRFLNEQAVSDPSGVVQTILAAAGADTPTPNPSPQGGGAS